MRSHPPSLRAFAVFLLFAALLAIGVQQRTSADPGEKIAPSGAEMMRSSDREEKSMSPDATWKEIDRLIDEQKFEAAATRVAEIREQARQRGNDEDWARALIREVQLRTGLHGYETAVRFLREQPWPDDPRARLGLELFYAQTLRTYHRAYSWEIAQREEVVSQEEVDLKAWTSEQIVAEAQAALARAWSRRDRWGLDSLGELSERVEQNDYPARIRGTLRDTATYLWVDWLADTSLWTPAQSNGIFRLPLEQLATSHSQAWQESDLVDEAVHPLQKIAFLLADLEDWHAEGKRPEAAFEARRERIQRLAASFARDDDQELLRGVLETRLEGLGRQYPWWSLGMSTLAEMTRSGPEPSALTRAHEIATEGARAHPDSIGAKRCLFLAASLEAPSFDLTAMHTDGPGRRSIQVQHRNLERLYFRAYRLDVRALLAGAQDYNVLPRGREILAIVDGREPDVSWQVDLPETPDLRIHRTFFTPPFDEPGTYVVAASARSDFRERRNQRSAVHLVIGDLVLLSRQQGARLEVQARRGSSGRAIAGAVVSLYRYDWKQGHAAEQRLATDASGEAIFAIPPDRQRRFVVAEHDGDFAFDLTTLYGFESREPEERTSSLIYTDRSVYRPGQEILWKSVAYHGGGSANRYRTLPERELRLELRDANGEVVAESKARTNGFGSTSGSFVIPAGRLLGSWSIRSSLGGQTAIRVEEYKRPTFEVEVLDPETEMRLNRPAELTGAARYYFGLPLVSGKVDWQVTREPIYPYWWSTYGRPVVGTETLAAGETQLDADGCFHVRFVPEADERDRDLTYRFRLRVDVTDDGGETRSATRAFRLGFVAVEASLSSEAGFYRPGEPIVVHAHRNDLNGTARPGSARFELLQLDQPDAVQLPADLPVATSSDDEDRYKTPGDRLRPRWESSYRPEGVLRTWNDGPKVQSGELLHDDDGNAEIRLPKLAAGAYRLRYTTEDRFGSSFETTREFVVAAEGRTPLALPAVLLVEKMSVSVGETARLLVHSGLADQSLLLETFVRGEKVRSRRFDSADGLQVVEIPVGEGLRGGFGFTLTAVRDHQWMQLSGTIYVPWEDRQLHLAFETFRDRLRPGSQETWRVRLESPQPGLLERGAAEFLAYMYDRSLDVFAPHQPPHLGELYPSYASFQTFRANLGAGRAVWGSQDNFFTLPDYPQLRGDRLRDLSGYGVGGLGGRRFMRQAMKASAVASPMPASAALAEEDLAGSVPERRAELADAGAPPEADEVKVEGDPVRKDFSETAFWEPHLLLDEDGGVSFEFQVPDSVTEWNVWVHALSRDLRMGSLKKEARSVKDLLVRPYVPRFFREGDQARLEIVVNNAGDLPLEGRLDFEIFDPETGDSLLADFGLDPSRTQGLPFTLEPGGGDTISLPLEVPSRVGTVAFKAVGRAGDLADGEQRALPILPGRMHLAQSRFVSLRDADRRTMRFDDLARASEDPTLLQEQLVVTLDGQLFYGVLGALPYLVDYPYECTEQTLNRFVSTGIVSSVFERYPAVARMAEQLAERETRYEQWDDNDPNRAMELVETPWLRSARGGDGVDEDLLRILDPRVAAAQRSSALAQLEKIQTSLGAFPWWPGGPPSPYMTLYLLHGLSHALEFGVEVPQDLVTRAWSYLHRHYVDEMTRDVLDGDCCWEMVTFLNYVLSSYPDASWTGGVFTDADRKDMLDFSLRHWKEHAPLSKAQLALTLARSGRAEDAELVFDSIMDSAKTTRDEGTFWAPEDRGWLWYNDRIETHAMALRTLTELAPDDPRRHGLVQWLFLNKKLGHWKSTRATAEVLYSLVHYLDREGSLGQREEATVELGPVRRTFVFDPDEYTGGQAQLVVPGNEVDAETMAEIEVSKESPGLLFASATWHFSTEKLPEEARGDLFHVERSYFRRVHDGRQWTLRPLAEGDALSPGDQLEVHLSIRARHAAEYVHLRDPRGAGFEPESTTSRYRWDLGLAWYEEIRDSGTNFFFEWLPAGEYTLKYRVRANMKGTFRIGPATLQSMYAPEFVAYSAGHQVKVDE